MKLKTVRAELENACGNLHAEAEKIKVCCVYGRKKYKLKSRLCARCRQRLESILKQTA